MGSAGSHTRPYWRMTGGRRFRPFPFLIAGIVNVTPDSFSDGGSFLCPQDALRHVEQIVAEGADMIDLGAESTRPGAEDIGHQGEWRRLQPVLEGTLAFRARTPVPWAVDKRNSLERSLPLTVAVDTFRAQTAVRALSMSVSGEDGRNGQGVDVINDISGAAFDPGMVDVLAQFKPGYVLGHSPARPRRMQVNPRYDNVVDELLAWFSARMDTLVKAGLPEECISLDPCIGFGKTLQHILDIIAAIPRFRALGRPLYFGISRKSFLGAITGQDAGHRDNSTLAATALLAQAGVAVHRVHRVADALAALKVAHAFVAPALP